MRPLTIFLVLLTLGLTILEVALTGYLWRQPWLFSLIAWQMVFILVGYAALTRDAFLARLLLLPLTANLLQPLVDWYHVHQVQTLVYDYAWFRVGETPDYILAGWLFAFTQLGYIALWLRPRLGSWPTVILLTLGGTVLHSWYEEMAYQAGAWRYVNAALVAHVSVWVIISFLLILFTLVWLILRLENRPAREWAAAGLLVGLAIFVFSALSVALFRWPPLLG